MPKFKNVLAAFAISTVLTGGAVGLGAATTVTSASATTVQSGWGWGNHCGCHRWRHNRCNNGCGCHKRWGCHKRCGGGCHNNWRKRIFVKICNSNVHIH